jgi:hypothetical protein
MWECIGLMGQLNPQHRLCAGHCEAVLASGPPVGRRISKASLAGECNLSGLVVLTLLSYCTIYGITKGL